MAITITDALVAEHRVFLNLFDQIERALPSIKTVGEVALLCRLLAGLLHEHGGIETDLAYITLDHVLHEQDQLTRLNHDHQEIDGLLKNVETSEYLQEARARLKACLIACRIHFNEEEHTVFPLMSVFSNLRRSGWRQMTLDPTRNAYLQRSGFSTRQSE